MFFLVTEAESLKLQFSSCKTEVEAHYKSPPAGSVCIGSLGHSELQTGAVVPVPGRMAEKQPVFFQGGWDRLSKRQLLQSQRNSGGF